MATGTGVDLGLNEGAGDRSAAHWRSRAVGVATLLAVAFAALALATWTATDPNVNYAAAGTPENWLGWWGASKP